MALLPFHWFVSPPVSPGLRSIDALEGSAVGAAVIAAACLIGPLPIAGLAFAIAAALGWCAWLDKHPDDEVSTIEDP